RDRGEPEFGNGLVARLDEHRPRERQHDDPGLELYVRRGRQPTLSRTRRRREWSTVDRNVRLRSTQSRGRLERANDNPIVGRLRLRQPWKSHAEGRQELHLRWLLGRTTRGLRGGRRRFLQL